MRVQRITDRARAFVLEMPVATEAEVLASTRALCALVDATCPVLAFNARQKSALGLVKVRTVRATRAATILSLKFSPYLMALPEHARRETVAHEVAHLVAIPLGDLGHGRIWACVMRELGLPPERVVTGSAAELVRAARAAAGDAPKPRAPRPPQPRVEIACGCPRGIYRVSLRRANKLCTSAKCSRCHFGFRLVVNAQGEIA